MAIIKLPPSQDNAYNSGETYLNRLANETATNFAVFRGLLSSYFTSTIDGPNYLREMKAMAISLSQIRLALADVQSDISYNATRTEFLYQVLTSMLFPNEAPNPDLADLDFEAFLNQIITIYFMGTTPLAMQQAVQLLVGGMNVNVVENFIEARKGYTGEDISDEFTFDVNVELESPGSIDTFLADKNIRILLGIIRPAHTLYRLKFILNDSYVGNISVIQPNKVVDDFKMHLSNYGYEDFRKFVDGINGVDDLGMKRFISVVGEVHTGEFS